MNRTHRRLSYTRVVHFLRPDVRRSLIGGNTARDRRDWPEAARLYSSYLRICPGSFPIWVQLGHALKEAGRSADSLAAYSEAMRLNGDDADLLLNLGHLYQRLGLKDKAIEHYRRSAAIDGNPEARLALRALNVSPSDETRTRILTTVAPVTPGLALAVRRFLTLLNYRNRMFRLRGNRSRDAKNWPEAAEWYRRYLRGKPKDDAIWVQLGHAMKENGQHEKALEAYKEAIALNPTDADLLKHYRHLQGLMGNTNVIDTTPRQGAIELEFCIDTPQTVDGVFHVPSTNVHFLGWAVAPDKIHGVTAHLGDEVVLPVHYGVPRADVLAVRETNPNGLNTGFSMFAQELPEGCFRLNFRIELTTRQVIERGFDLVVAPPNDARRTHRPRAYAERRLWELANSRNAKSGADQSIWAVVIQRPNETDGGAEPDADFAEAAAATIASLAETLHGGWRIRALVPDISGLASSEIVTVFRDEVHLLSILKNFAAKPSEHVYLSVFEAGDLLDSAAPVILAALASDQSDLLYWDERSTFAGRTIDLRKTPGAPFVTEFHMNSVGRGWSIRLDRRLIDVIEQEGLELAAAKQPLHLFYQAPEHCRHVPEVLTMCRYARKPSEWTPSDLRARQSLISKLGARFGAPSLQQILDEGVTPSGPTMRLTADLTEQPLVSIIIPTIGTLGRVFTFLNDLRSRTHYKSIEIIVLDHMDSTPKNIEPKQKLRDLADIVVPVSGPFNWSAFNNLGARHASGDVLLFMNDDLEVITEDWLDILIGYLNLPKVGVVGPRLLLEGGRLVQSAGVSLIGYAGWARNDFAFSSADHSLADGVNRVPRNCTSLLGAAIAVARDLYDILGGFEEELPLTFNDLDFHMRVRNLGYQVVIVPSAELTHHEKTSRAELTEAEMEPLYWRRWACKHFEGDDYWHPAIERQSGVYRVDPEPVEAILAGSPVGIRSELKRMLFLRLDHVGDFVITLPAFRQIRMAFPNARLTIVVGAWNRELARGCGLFDEVYVFNLYAARSGDGRAIENDTAGERLADLLIDKHYDLAVDCRADGDTRFLLNHVNATFRAGFSHGTNYPWLDVAVEWEGNLPQWRKQVNGSHLLRRLFGELELAFPTAEPQLGSFWSSDTTSQLAKLASPTIVVHPFAGNEIKMWPVAHWDGLARLLAAAGFAVEMIGTPAEASAYPELVVTLATAGVKDRIGHFSLPELVEFIGQADCFVGMDSGPKHIAASTGIPTVGIQSGFVDPVTWSPFNPLGLSIVKRVPCAPCYLDELAKCNHGHDCMRQIYPSQVFRFVTALVHPPSATSPQNSLIVSKAQRAGPEKLDRDLSGVSA